MGFPAFCGKVGICGGLALVAFVGGMLWAALAVVAIKLLGVPASIALACLGAVFLPGPIWLAAVVSVSAKEDPETTYQMAAVFGVIAALSVGNGLLIAAPLAIVGVLHVFHRFAAMILNFGRFENWRI